MNVLVDADSLPKQIRIIVLRASKKRNLNITFISDRFLKDVKMSYDEHTSDLRKAAQKKGITDKKELLNIKSSISQIVVETGDDSADDKLVEIAQDGDLAITHDIPLADRLVTKQVLVLDDRGAIYTSENIKTRLSLRNAMTELRSYGVQLEKTNGLKDKDVKAFSDAFSKNLDKLMQKK